MCYTFHKTKPFGASRKFAAGKNHAAHKQEAGPKQVFAHSLVPVFFALVECGKHYGDDGGCVIANQTHDVFIVPEVQSALGNLHAKAGSCIVPNS